jgi:hypothetical protein
MMAMMQFAKATFMLSVAAVPLIWSEDALNQIPNVHDLLFLASHGKDPKGLLIVFLGVYAAAIGWGLWHLKRWARNSLVASSGMMLIFWLAHNEFGTQILLMQAVSSVERQTVDILLLLDCTIFAYLQLHTGVRRSFPRKLKKKKRPAQQAPPLYYGMTNKSAE